METSLFAKGIILGLSIAAPVGPIGVLCIQRTLQFGRLSGFASGLGAAAADTTYGIVAAFGLTLVSNFLLAGQFWFQLIGGFFLLLLGLKTFYTKSAEKSTPVTHRTLLGDFVSTFFLTIANPMTILAYFAVFAGFGLSSIAGNYLEAFMLIVGVFLGSALWWLILSEGVTLFRKQISQQVMKWINRLAGTLIIAFGIMILFETAVLQQMLL